MSKPSKSTIKAFAVASTIGAVLKSNNNGEPKLIYLALQINKAMKVFSYKAGRKLYWKVSNEVAEMWGRVAKDNMNVVLEDEVPAFIEYLCMLVPPRDFKTFLGMSPYRTSVKLDKEKNAHILKSILMLDAEMNELIGTKPYALIKPKEKILKVKKQRDKAKPKQKEVKVSSAKIKKSESRKRTQRLREIIAAAKQKRK